MGPVVRQGPENLRVTEEYASFIEQHEADCILSSEQMAQALAGSVTCGPVPPSSSKCPMVTIVPAPRSLDVPSWVLPLRIQSYVVGLALAVLVLGRVRAATTRGASIRNSKRQSHPCPNLCCRLATWHSVQSSSSFWASWKGEARY